MQPAQKQHVQRVDNLTLLPQVGLVTPDMSKTLPEQVVQPQRAVQVAQATTRHLHVKQLWDILAKQV